MAVMKPRGVFVNSKKAQCSIYESGRMAFACLRLSSAYSLDYLEVDAEDHDLSGNYDFILFNYHHVTMSWLDTRAVRSLPGLKITLVLEVAPGDPFVLCPKEDFDAYLPLDPSLVHGDRRVFPIPRPLEIPAHIEPYVEKDVPVIGSFGFATPGKGFEMVVDAVGREFSRAIVRINVPSATYADSSTFAFQGRPYADYLEDLCRRVARPGIEVEFGRRYMDESELIAWCAQNTLNCFLYTRDQPGLSATTDQAIAAARPMAVNTNPTFRHIHPYLTPYPYRSLKDSIACSLPEVMAMRQDWTGQAIALRFEEVLAHHGLLPAPVQSIRLRVLPETDRIPILLVNHPQKQCGIHQYGEDMAGALQASRRYSVHYVECSNQADLEREVDRVCPRAVIYNHYPLTMPWLSPEYTRTQGVPQVGVMHEVTQEDADQADTSLFDFHLCPDPTLDVRNPICLKIPRLVPTYINTKPLPATPRIGTFGFAFADKGFERIVRQVQDEFDQAAILIHAPSNDLVNSDMDMIIDACRQVVTKPGIEVLVNQKFLTLPKLLDFLASNSINVFLYDEHKHRGISSAVEKAMAVQRPVAVNRAGMFRHLHGATPSVTLGDRSLREIMADGVAPLVPFLQEWSPAAFVKAFEGALDRVMEAPGSSPRDHGTAVEHCLLWIRGQEDPNDALALATLEPLAKAYPTHQIVAVVPSGSQDLFRACPHIDKIITADPRILERSPRVLSALKDRLRALHADIGISTSDADDALAADLLQASDAGRQARMGRVPELDPRCRVVVPEDDLEPELDRHRRLLEKLEVPCPEDLKPVLWLSRQDVSVIDERLEEMGVPGGKALAYFPFSESHSFRVPAMDNAVLEFAQRHGLRVLVLGPAQAFDLAESALGSDQSYVTNLCGALSMGQVAALIKRCGLSAGLEGRWVHMACALGIPNVLALGGGTFSRYAPSSRYTTAVCLPLNCYGCGWECPHPRGHCISDVHESSFRNALELAWSRDGLRPRLLIQEEGIPDTPELLDLRPLLNPDHVECLPASTMEPSVGEGRGKRIAVIMAASTPTDALRGFFEHVRLSPDTTVILAATKEDSGWKQLERAFPHRLLLLDARECGESSRNRPINLAFQVARERGFELLVHLDGESRPITPTWHQDLESVFTRSDFQVGMLPCLLDEEGRSGWCGLAGYAVSPYWVGRIEAFGEYFLNPTLEPLLASLDLVLRMQAKGLRPALLPIPLAPRLSLVSLGRPEFRDNLPMLLAQHPGLRGRIHPDLLFQGHPSQVNWIENQGVWLECQGQPWSSNAEKMEDKGDPAVKGLLALLLPSKGRWLDLVLTLLLTPLCRPDGVRVRFFVCSNYGSIPLLLLRLLFFSRATFIDERKLAWSGMTGAYNHAFNRAVKAGAQWVALWADDLLPERKDWLNKLQGILRSPGFRFGVFSSDEGNHKGGFGWNVFGGYPCAHFFVARVDSMPGYMLSPKLRAYVSDNEMAISRIKAGIPVDFIPVRVIHQPTANATRSGNSPNYLADLQRFYEIHPELRGRLDGVVLHGNLRDGQSAFVPDKGAMVRFSKELPKLDIDAFLRVAPGAEVRASVRYAGRIRAWWNEQLPASFPRLFGTKS